MQSIEHPSSQDESLRNRDKSPWLTATMALLKFLEETMKRTTLSKSLPHRHIGLKKALLYTAVLGGAYFLFKWFSAIPSCAGGEVRESVEFTIFAALRTREPDTVPSRPKMMHAREIGHAAARRERGCIATVRAGKESISYAYIVSPRKARRGPRTKVTGAHHLLVEARFGNLDSDGDFGNKAEPLGRESLEAALRAALEKPNLFATGTYISQVEPLGSCRAVQGDTRYACNVMIELSDPLRTSAKMVSGTLQVELMFERESAQSPWRISDDFHIRYLRALHEARKNKSVAAISPAA